MYIVLRGHNKCVQCIFYRNQNGCCATPEQLEEAIEETGIDCLSEKGVIYAKGSTLPDPGVTISAKTKENLNLFFDRIRSGLSAKRASIEVWGNPYRGRDIAHSSLHGLYPFWVYEEYQKARGIVT